MNNASYSLPYAAFTVGYVSHKQSIWMNGCQITHCYNSLVFFNKRWPAVWTTNTRKHGHLSTSPSEDYMDLGYDLRWLIRQMTNQRSKTGTACDVMFRIDQSSQWIGSSVNKLHKPSVCPSAIHLISAPGRCPLTQREVSGLHYLCSHVSLLFSMQYSSVFA